MTYFVYILKSLSSGRLYIGHTQDITLRLVQHNRGHSKSTRKRGPWELVHKIEFASRAEAMRLESKLKGMKNPKRALVYVRKLLQKD